MSETGQKVAIVTGGSRGIGAGLVDGYRQRRWAVVVNSLNTKLSKDPDVLTVEVGLPGAGGFSGSLARLDDPELLGLLGSRRADLDGALGKGRRGQGDE